MLGFSLAYAQLMPSICRVCWDARARLVRELFACFLYVDFNVFVVWLTTLKFLRY
jgi:hypothetical protein